MKVKLKKPIMLNGKITEPKTKDGRQVIVDVGPTLANDLISRDAAVAVEEPAK